MDYNTENFQKMQAADPELYGYIYPHMQNKIEQIRKTYPAGYHFTDDMLNQMAREVIDESGIDVMTDDMQAIPVFAMRDPMMRRDGRRHMHRDRGFANNFAKALLIGSLFGNRYNDYPDMNYPYPYCNYNYCPGYPNIY